MASAVAPGHLQQLHDPVSSAQAAAGEGAQARLRGVHGQVRVLHAGGGDEQRVAVEREDGAQLEEVHREVTGQGPGQAAEGDRVRVKGGRVIRGNEVGEEAAKSHERGKGGEKMIRVSFTRWRREIDESRVIGQFVSATFASWLL